MATTYLDPISRIEGHLGANITSSSNYVTEADVHGNLWRGFENFLVGRDPNDAITFVQRICGVCPVPHGMTSTHAIESVYGYNNNFHTYKMSAVGGAGVPLKALHIRNLVLGAEFLMSSITHFYHLAAPSYVQGPNVPPWTPYFATSYYHPYLLATAAHGSGDATGGDATHSTLPADHANGFSKSLWSAVIKSYVHALRIRRLTFEAGAMFAGRMPMTSSYVAGGVTVPREEDLSGKCKLYQKFMVEVGNFIVTEYIPIVLALGALYPNWDNWANAKTLAGVVPAIWTAGDKTGTAAATAAAATGAAAASGWSGFGAGVGRFLAWGGFPQSNDTLLLPGGTAVASGTSVTVTPLIAGKSDESTASATVKSSSGLTEDVAHSRYNPAQSWGYPASGTAAYPGDVTRTEPVRDATTSVTSTGKYSWIKSPRWNGQSMEVGPLARLVVAGDYPADGVTKFAASAISGTYLAYTKTTTGVGTLPSGRYIDPQMIAPDLAVSLIREGLAEFWDATGTVHLTQANVDTSSGLPSIPASGLVSTYLAGFVDGTITAWVLNLTGGLSTMDRLRARAIESLVLIQAMIGSVGKAGAGPTWAGGAAVNTTPASCGWLGELYVLPEYGTSGSGANGVARSTGINALTFNYRPTPSATTSGFGTTEAPRGALAHFVTIDGGAISHYQCVVPTTWNGAPKDKDFSYSSPDAAHRGPIEQAMVGSYISGASTTAVEQLRIAQSFDPCIACAVH